jgi:hypothetical protein
MRQPSTVTLSLATIAPPDALAEFLVNVHATSLAPRPALTAPPSWSAELLTNSESVIVPPVKTIAPPPSFVSVESDWFDVNVEPVMINGPPWLP